MLTSASFLVLTLTKKSSPSLKATISCPQTTNSPYSSLASISSLFNFCYCYACFHLLRD
jgi:hypothetical protein